MRPELDNDKIHVGQTSTPLSRCSLSRLPAESVPISPIRAQCALRARARIGGSIARPQLARTREWGHHHSHYSLVPKNMLENVKVKEQAKSARRPRSGCPHSGASEGALFSLHGRAFAPHGGIGTVAPGGVGGVTRQCASTEV